MAILLAEIQPDDVVRAFKHDVPYLFAGAAFITVGIIALAFTAFRKKYDQLLIYFAIFASLYGLRLWLQSDLGTFSLRSSFLFMRLRTAIDYLMPVPAFLFLNAAGLLRRFARIVLSAFALFGLSCAIAACVWGPSNRLSQINQLAAIIALIVLTGSMLRKNSSAGPDLAAVRRGLLVFVALALFNNLREALNFPVPGIEPVGFAIFLGSLGYVAARRTLQRDHELREIQSELEIAKRIQSSILPSQFSPSDNFRVAARYLPMTSVAGDFYDFIATKPSHAGLLIADASGHGVPAALIASMVKVAAGTQRIHARHPAEFLCGMNNALCGNTQDQFVTAAYVYLDSESEFFSYAAAGHPPLLLLRDRQVQEIEENGLVLGLMEDASYSEVNHPLLPGDRLLLYTDGLLEAANPAAEFFGKERLSRLLIATAGLSTDQAADRMLSTVRDWSPKQEDDLTVIVCDFRGCTKPDTC
jgi:sigma-B regulation protein RsbU (phosphoserine phosphatase)